MPCAKVMVAKLCGEDQANKLSVVPLSNDTIRRRVDDMAENILVQVIEEVKSSPVKFCLQFDESTDIASCAVLLGYIRYVHCNMIKEEFLLCENLTTTTKGEDVFNTVSHFLQSNGMDWHRVSRRCTCHDGWSTRLERFCEKSEPEYTSRSLHHLSVFTRIQDTASFLESSFRRCCQNRELHQIKGLELSHIQTILQ